MDLMHRHRIFSRRGRYRGPFHALEEPVFRLVMSAFYVIKDRYIRLQYPMTAPVSQSLGIMINGHKLGWLPNELRNMERVLNVGLRVWDRVFIPFAHWEDIWVDSEGFLHDKKRAFV